jgi:hypothetical protein
VLTLLAAVGLVVAVGLGTPLAVRGKIDAEPFISSVLLVALFLGVACLMLYFNANA